MLIAVAAAMWFFVGSWCRADEKKPPNIVFIFTDDQGYGDLGCFDSKDIRTPNIDRMASEGVKLTSFYAMPLCTPSRAALMTGCYPVRVGLGRGSRHGVLLDADTNGLNPDEVTMAEVLKSRGYATAMFGKWHLGDQPKFLPTRQGFDVFYGLPYSHDIHPLNTRRHFSPLPLLDGEKVVAVNPPIAGFTRLFTDKAIQFIQAHHDVPFFVYLAHPMPHGPIAATQPFIDKLDNVPATIEPPFHSHDVQSWMYPAVLDELDYNVGRILDTLKQLGLDDNTLVIFTSDNGPPAMKGSAGPLRGRKGSIYEGGLREPCVMRWPGHIPANTAIGDIVTTMDMLPTLARFAGAKVSSDRVIDGVDMTDLLTGHTKTPPRDTFFYYGGNSLGAVRQGPWKLFKKGMLYNLDDDIGETTDVSQAHPEIVAKLKVLLNQQDQSMPQQIRPCGKVEHPVPLVSSE